MATAATAEKPTAAKATTPVAPKATTPATPTAVTPSTEAPKTPKGVMKTAPKGMHLEYGDSMGIENLIPYYVYDDAAAIDADAGKPGTACKLANAYMRQKGVLVWGRDQISAYIAEMKAPDGTLLFPPALKAEKYKVDGVEKTRNVWIDTETEYFNKFKVAVLKGDVKTPEFPGSSEQAFDAAACALAKKLGPWACSAKEAERTASEKNPPKYAIANAESIFSDTDKDGKTKSTPLSGRLKTWAEKFTAEGITYEDFTVGAPAKATDEDKASTRAANITKLAWAIKAREDAKAVKEYV